jgi:hypothetical protein
MCSILTHFSFLTSPHCLKAVQTYSIPLSEFQIVVSTLQSHVITYHKVPHSKTPHYAHFQPSMDITDDFWIKTQWGFSFPPFFFFWEGPRNRCYGRTAALRLLVQPCAEDERWCFFLFLQVMNHRWNEIGRWKPKYSGGKTCPSAPLPPQIPHWLTRDRARASLTAWAMARPVYCAVQTKSLNKILVKFSLRTVNLIECKGWWSNYQLLRRYQLYK